MIKKFLTAFTKQIFTDNFINIFSHAFRKNKNRLLLTNIQSLGSIYYLFLYQLKTKIKFSLSSISSGLEFRYESYTGLYKTELIVFKNIKCAGEMLSNLSNDCFQIKGFFLTLNI